MSVLSFLFRSNSDHLHGIVKDTMVVHPNVLVKVRFSSRFFDFFSSSNNCPYKHKNKNGRKHFED